MPALLALVAPALLWLALVSRAQEWRRALLWTALCGGAFVVATTEALSRWESLAWPQLIVVWTLATIAAAAAIDRPGLRARGLGIRFDRRSAVAWIVVAACGLSLGGSLLSALYGPPNTVDAMTYHMPRVVYWHVNQTVDFYPASYYQQLSLQPFMEHAMLQLYTLGGGDRYVLLPQWFAWLITIVAASLTAQRLGAGTRGQALAAGLCATLPNGALQASGAKPDIMAAGWLLIAAYFALGSEEEPFDRREAAGAGLAGGLALLSKGTAYLFGAGLAAGLLLGLSAAGRRRLLRAAPLAVGLALLVNLPHYARNYSTTRSRWAMARAAAAARTLRQRALRSGRYGLQHPTQRAAADHAPARME